MSKIKLNNHISIDVAKLIESRLLVQANSGGGKSWAIRRIIEQVMQHDKHVQVIVLDPEGEFGNLRSKYDFVYVGEGGDAPTESRSASLLARRLLELNASAIVDLYELHPNDRKKFVRIFCESMVNAPKELWHDTLIIIDEAHVFAPEKGESEAMGPVIDLATRGRKRGYCVVLATQRLPKLNKDAAAECNNKLIGRASQDIDRKRAAEELGFTTKEQILSLRDLNPGEFYVFGPAISRDVIRTVIGDVTVKPPKRGQGKNAPPAPTEKVKKILQQFKDLPAEAKKEIDTIQSLTQKNIALESQIRSHKCPVGPDPEKVNEEANRLIAKAKIEMEQSFDEEMRRFKKRVLSAKDTVVKLSKTLSGLHTFIEEIEKDNPPKNITLPTVRIPIANRAVERAPIMRLPRPEVAYDGQSVSNSEQKVLDAIAWFESIGIAAPKKISVAFVAGYSGTSGGYNNLCGMLRSKGFIAYPSAGALALTEAGNAIAQRPQSSPTQEELHEKVLAVIPVPEGKLLRQLLNVYPADLSVQELADASGYQASSGGFNNLKGRLRSLGLADYPTAGRVRAADLLFL